MPNPVLPPQFVVLDDELANWPEHVPLPGQVVAIDVGDGNPVEALHQAQHAQAIAQMDLAQQELKMATLSTGSSFYNAAVERLYGAEVKKKPSELFKQQKQRILELEKSLIAYDGYITQRQLMETVNRVMASKKLKRFRPVIGGNKTDYLNALINHLWEVLPDPETKTTVKDVDDDSEA